MQFLGKGGEKRNIILGFGRPFANQLLWAIEGFNFLHVHLLQSPLVTLITNIKIYYAHDKLECLKPKRE